MVRLRDKELQWRELEGEIVVLDLRSSQYFVVNGSGASLWHLLNTDHTLEQLADELSHRYDVPLDTATEHVQVFINQLDERGLVTS